MTRSRILVFLLLFFPFGMFLSPASYGQGWAWGRQGINGGIDAWPVAIDHAGNVYGAGFKWNPADVVDFGSGVTSAATTGTGLATVWVKYSNSGTPIYSGETLDGDTYLYNIAVDPSDNLIIYGAFESATMKIGSFTLTNPYGGAFSFQYFLAKVSPTGTVLWAINAGHSQDYYDLTIVPPADILGDGGVCTDNAGNIYISGSFGQPMTLGTTTFTPSGIYDGFVAKYSPAGSLIWANSFGGSGADYTVGIAVASTGEVYVCGETESPSMTVGTGTVSGASGAPVAYIAEFSATGAPMWCDGGSGGASFAAGLASDNYGNIYMTGGFTDPSITLGGSTITRTYPAASPNLALFLVQYSSAHTATWTKTIGSATGAAWGYCIAMASCGQVWVSGNYNADVSIDGHTLVEVTDGVASPDPVFIAGYNLSGGVVGYAGLSSGGDDQNGIAADAHGNVFLCSDALNMMVVGPTTFPTPSAGPELMYIAKYANTAIAINDTATRHSDTTFCGPVSLTLNAPGGYANYYWDNGSTSQSRTITAAGTYLVYCISCGDTTLADTFHVNIAPGDTAYLHNDTTACAQDGSVSLTGPAGFDSYQWSTGSTSSTITAGSSGTYTVVAAKGCTCTIDTFHVILKPAPTVWLGNDTSICIGTSIMLHCPEPQGDTYLWSTGSTDTSIIVSTQASYHLAVTQNGCTTTDSINVYISTPPAITLGPDTTLCIGEIYTITASSAEATWNTGQTGASIQVTREGKYIATVNNACGIAKDTVEVNFGPCDIIVPNAFTPNKDGKNDIFRVYGRGLDHFSSFSLGIYNRYGQRVYYSTDILGGWDGNFNGTPQDLGTYFYLVEYTLLGKHHMLKGDLELVK